MANLLVPHAPSEAPPRAGGAAESAMDLDVSANSDVEGDGDGDGNGDGDGGWRGWAAGSATGLAEWLSALADGRLAPQAAGDLSQLPLSPSPPIALFLRNVAEVTLGFPKFQLHQSNCKFH